MGIPLRVLIVEDSEDDALLLLRMLKKAGFKPVHQRVETADAMHAALAAEPWDIILSDYKMPHFSGIAALQLFKESGLDIPFIIVSGTIGEELAVEAMKAGANDYVMKENLSRLIPAIKRELTDADIRNKRIVAEKKLSESEKKYKDIYDNAIEGIYQASPEGQFISMNPAYYKMFGYDSAEEMMTCITDIGRQLYVNPQDRERLKKLLTDTGFTEGFETQLYRKDGSIIWISINAHAVRDPDSNILYFEGTNEDITDRKLAEKAIKESEEKYRRILENIDDAYYELDLKGNLVFFNESLISKTGYSRKELMGMNYRQYISPETLKTVSKVFAEIYRTGQPVRLFDYEVIRKGGEKRNYESWANLLSDNDNKPIGFRGMARDITARKRAEEALKNSLSSLRKTLGATIQTVAVAVEAKDPYTAGHQRRVADLARSIATEMGLTQDQIDGVRLAGLIHDLGKISIPGEILSKPKILSKLERQLIETHTHVGHDILKDMEFPWPIARIILEHHERMDGSGYPRGLKGEDILLESRILIVADVVEAMASHRPYRPSLGIKEALDEITKSKNILYDPDAVDTCLRLFNEKNYQIVD